MKDSEIIDLYWQRNETAISETSAKYGAYCRTVSRNILANDEDAEECVNDTWLGAWDSMPPHRPDDLAAFLGKITRNLSLNRLKRYSAQKRGGSQTELALSELEECIPAPAETDRLASDEAITEAVNSFLHAQPEQKRNIFIRRYWYLYSVRDVAAAYGISESKAASILFRMRAQLRKHLEKEGICV